MARTSRRAILAGIAAAPLAAIPIAAQGHPDAVLLRLGVAFDRARADEARAYHGPEDVYTAAYDRTSRLVQEIERIPAQTLDGSLVKARAALWAFGDDFVETNAFTAMIDHILDENAGVALIANVRQNVLLNVLHEIVALKLKRNKSMF